MKIISYFCIFTIFLFVNSVFADAENERISVVSNPLDKAFIKKQSGNVDRTHIIMTDKDASVMGDYSNVRFHPVYLLSSSIDDFKIIQIIKLLHSLQGNIIICSSSPNGIPIFCKSLYDAAFGKISKEKAVKNISVDIPDSKILRSYIIECDIDDLRNKVLEQGKHKRSAEWAAKMKVPEFDNLYKVSDKLYRGEQPDRAGLNRLYKMGIGSIISLRGHNIDAEIGKDINLDYYHVPISLTLNKDGSSPELDREIIKALRIISSSAKPVFIHCFHGSDRTGLVAFAYRVVLQGWSRDAAIDEMINGGFEFHYVKYLDYIKQMNIENIKREVLDK